MANVVEYLVKIRDLSSSQWRGMASNAEGAFNRIGAKVNNAGNSVDQLNRKIDALTKTRNISIDGSQVNRINGELDKLESKRDRLQNMGRKKSNMLSTGLMWGAIAGAAYLGKDAIQRGIDRQMTQTSFEVMLGKKPGDKLNNDLLQFDRQSVYGDEVFKEGKLMAGSGIKSNNIMPVLRMMGDIASGDNNRMQSLALAFSEASTRGNLNGMNERMFLQGGLFNPLEQIHKMSGESMANLKKDMAHGKISIDELVKAMEYATGPLGRWFEMSKKMQETPAGKIIAFEGSLRTLAGTIGQKLLPVLGGLAGFMHDIIDNRALLWGIADAIGGMTIAWGAYAVVTNWAAISSAALELAAYWPLAVVGLVAGAIGYLMNANEDYAGSTENAATRTGGAVALMRRSWETFAYSMENVWLRISDVYERIAGFLTAKTWKGEWQAITGDTDAGNQLKKLQLNREWHKAMDYAGFDDNGKKKKTGTPLDAYSSSKYTPTGSTAPAVVSDTANGIAGGGVRNLVINIAKQGIDNITIHAATLTEGKNDIQRMFIEMFNQVVNSGNAAVNHN